MNILRTLSSLPAFIICLVASMSCASAGPEQFTCSFLLKDETTVPCVAVCDTELPDRCGTNRYNKRCIWCPQLTQEQCKTLMADEPKFIFDNIDCEAITSGKDYLNHSGNTACGGEIQNDINYPAAHCDGVDVGMCLDSKSDNFVRCVYPFTTTRK